MSTQLHHQRIGLAQAWTDGVNWIKANYPCSDEQCEAAVTAYNEKHGCIIAVRYCMAISFMAKHIEREKARR